MSSNVLPQALFTIPRNPKLCHPRTLGFSAFVAHRPSPFSSTRVADSRVTVNALGSGFDPVIMKLNGDRSFIVKAESNSGRVAEESENSEKNEAVDSGGPEAEAEVESEVTTVVEHPRKPRIKLGDIMGILNKRAVEASDNARPIPVLRTGDIVEIKMQVHESKRRLSVYKGIVMSKQNAGIHTTIRIRRIIAGTGVEIVFPVYSPLVKEIKVVKHRKVRRARLYYLRDKLPRFSTFK